MDSKRLKKKELLAYHLVSIATRYVDDVYCLKEPPYQIRTQYDLRHRSYKGFTLVAMTTEFSKQSGMWLMPTTSRNLHIKYELNTTWDKQVIDVSIWLLWQPSSHIAMQYEADAYCPNELPYQIWTQYNLRQMSYWSITVVAIVT